MSDGASFGVNAMQGGLGSNPWEMRLEAAQAANAEQKMQHMAGAASKATAATKAGEGVDPREAARLKKVSQDFESLFLSYMFKTMKQAGPQSDFLGKSQAEKIFTEMKDEEMAKGMAQAGGIGLAKLLEEQLLHTLAQTKTPKTPEI